MLGALALPPRAAAVVGNCSADASWGTPRTDLAGSIVQLVNQHRASLGLAPLGGYGPLAAAAVWKARHMAAYGYMAHDDPAPPVARTTQQRFEACGFPSGARWGENLASHSTTAQAVLQLWLNSPGHRANIENAAFRTVGAGVAASSNGTLYWAMTFGSTGGSATPPPPPPPPPPPTTTASTTAAAPPPPPPQPPSPPPVTTPGPPAVVAQALAVRGVTVSPSRVRAGRRATVRLLLNANPTTMTALVCRARVRNTALRLVGRRFTATTRGSRATCTWRVPRGASGRLLRATVEVVTGGRTLTRRAARRIA